MGDHPAPGGPHPCPDCGTEVAPALRACPSCHRLVHAEALKVLAAEAEAASRAGDTARARDRWRQALDLLPPGSRQHAAIGERVAALELRAGPAPAEPRPGWTRRTGLFGVLALGVWKFKSIAAFVMSKGTLLTMLLSLGLYWTAWGWRFAAGLVAAIYVHEIGHVVALRRHGLAATAPMFVPGLGAFVRHPPIADPRVHARVALAGPLFGLAATGIAFVAFAGTGAPFWGGVAVWSARINLFNLLPVPPFDGAPLFAALDLPQRLVLLCAGGAAIYHTGEGMLWLVVPVMALRTLGERAAPTADPDWGLLVEAALVLLALSALAVIPVPAPL